MKNKDNLSFHIEGKKIRDRVRKSWGEVKPATKIEPIRKDKRVQNNLRHQIDEALEEEFDEYHEE